MRFTLNYDRYSNNIGAGDVHILWEQVASVSSHSSVLKGKVETTRKLSSGMFVGAVRQLHTNELYLTVSDSRDVIKTDAIVSFTPAIWGGCIPMATKVTACVVEEEVAEVVSSGQCIGLVINTTHLVYIQQLQQGQGQSVEAGFDSIYGSPGDLRDLALKGQTGTADVAGGAKGDKKKGFGSTLDNSIKNEECFGQLVAAQASDLLKTFDLAPGLASLTVVKSKGDKQALQQVEATMRSNRLVPACLRLPMPIRDPSVNPSPYTAGDYVTFHPVLDPSTLHMPPVLAATSLAPLTGTSSVKRLRGIVFRTDVAVPASPSLSAWSLFTATVKPARYRSMHMCEIRVIDTEATTAGLSVAVLLATAGQASVEASYYCDPKEITPSPDADAADHSGAGGGGGGHHRDNSNSKNSANNSGGGGVKVGDVVEFYPVDLDPSPGSVRGLAVAPAVLGRAALGSTVGGVSHCIYTHSLHTVYAYYSNIFPSLIILTPRSSSSRGRPFYRAPPPSSRGLLLHPALASHPSAARPWRRLVEYSAYIYYTILFTHTHMHTYLHHTCTYIMYTGPSR